MTSMMTTGSVRGKCARPQAGQRRCQPPSYGSDGAPLHDPCVTAYLLRPDLFSGRHVNVEIETQSELTMGMTVADWWGVTDRRKNATFMGTVDRDGYFRLIHDRLSRL